MFIVGHHSRSYGISCVGGPRFLHTKSSFQKHFSKPLSNAVVISEFKKFRTTEKVKIGKGTSGKITAIVRSIKQSLFTDIIQNLQKGYERCFKLNKSHIEPVVKKVN